MDKQQIISFIETQIAEGKISKEEVATITTTTATIATAVATKEEASKNLIGIFYSIGATIVVVGVGILVAQHWNEIGFAGRIVVTLGISLVTFIVALLLKKPEQKIISQVLFVIAAALAPLGSYVLLNQAGIDFDWLSQLVTAAILAIIFGVALFISKKHILVLVTIGFATWAYYAIIFKILGSTYYGNADFLKWATLLVGACYIFIAYGYKIGTEIDAKEKKSIKDVLYGFGSLAILGAGISLGGIFDLLYIAVIFAAFYGSVYLKSRAMLLLASIFLMAHIMKLTSQYFVGSVGWPVALIVIGFLVIGVGYMTFYLNKKFISSK